jgi:protocatechuate 3,4-dioxygenase beta subunit
MSGVVKVFGWRPAPPGAVPDPDGKPQAPHILMAVFARGMMQNYTRIYFNDAARLLTSPHTCGLGTCVLVNPSQGL